MSDIIQVLPDSVANQIAAGEVIQRPSSVVKELMENAIDAGADNIQLIVKESGKSLIQIIDNGCGMSETDARLCVERHATSKIRKAEDLFSIHTMGFRGEAMAAISAISQIDIKTKRREDELGTFIQIEGSKVNKQEACSTPDGTSIAVKNLFFNTPARRKFLKANPIELKHLIEEFQRIAIANPEVSFSMHHNNSELYHINTGSLRQRIVSIFGKGYNQKLVPVEEETNILAIKGFIGKPEFAKKTRGEQFFYVNGRYIKSPFLHHAIQMAFHELIPIDAFPSYFLLLNVDPKIIDINIHPTKTEIKFENERECYAILRSAIKQSLGKYNIAPSLDFEQESSIDIPTTKRDAKYPEVFVNPEYNPFEKKEEKEYPKTVFGTSHLEKTNKKHWEKLYPSCEGDSLETDGFQHIIHPDWEKDTSEANTKVTYQLHNQYILTHIKSGLMIIDQQRAHERILYERYIVSIAHNKGTSQQQLFPQMVEFTITDFELIKELQQDIHALGFDIREFGPNTFIVHGLPADTMDGDAKEMLEGLLENFKENLSEVKLTKQDNLARSLAKKMAIKYGKKLSNEEMNALIDGLFACEMPYASSDGKPTVITYTLQELEKRFNR